MISEIPITNEFPAQIFSIELNGLIFFLDFKFNGRSGRWLMDILDSTKVIILHGIPLLDENDMIGRFVNTGRPPGDFLVLDTQGEQISPDLDTIGDRVKVFYDDLIQ